MGINTGWGGGGAGGPITVDDITATGTPGASTFLRGDGAWAGAGTGVTLGSDSLESAGSTITIDLSASPITDAQYFRVNFEFEVDGACEVLLLLNGDADATGYYVDGSANVATIATLPGAGAQRGGGINITPSANSGGNLVCFGVADIWNPTSTIGDASLKWSKTLTGLTGITQIQLKTSANNFKAGSNVTITQVSGVGPKGDTGPAGPAGAGAIDASSVWYTGVAARGATNTLALRWSTNTQTVGTGITYSASVANGDSFTIVETGQYLILTGFYATTAFEACLHIGDSIVNSVAFAAATVVDFALINTNHYLNGPSFCGQIEAGKKVWVTTGAAPYNVYPGKNRIQIMRIG